MYHTLFCLLVMLPYVSLVWRFPSQVQPWAALAGWLGLGLLHLTHKEVRLSRADLLLIGVSLFMTLYIRDPAHLDWGVYVKRCLGVIFSLGIYLFGKHVLPENVGKAAAIALVPYLFFALLQYASLSAYRQAVSYLVPDINLGFSIGERGAQSLAPESTDFGFTAVYLGLFATLAQGSHATSALSAWASRIGALLCVILSKSAAGVFAGVAVTLSALSLRVWTPTRVLGGLIVLLTIGGLALIPQVRERALEIRGIRLLATAVTNPTELNQTSFIHRYVHNMVGIAAFQETYGLGYGAGTFTQHAPAIYARHAIASNIDMTRYHDQAVVTTLGQGPVGVLPMLLLEYGVFGVLFALVTFNIGLQSTAHFKWTALLLLVLTWLQSFPIAYPPFWLLLGLLENPAFARTWSIIVTGPAPPSAPPAQLTTPAT
jgi:hypothetical protein